MKRRTPPILGLLATLSILTACKSAPSVAPPVSPPPTPSAALDPDKATALLMRHIKADHHVSPVRNVAVPDMYFYVVETAPHTGGQHGAAVMAGRPAPLTGKEAFREAAAKVGRSNPTLLARLALLLVRGGENAHRVPWTPGTGNSSRVPEQQRLASAPRIDADTLEYWHFHHRMADLVRVRMSLTTLDSTTETGGSILEEMTAPKDPVVRAAAEIKDANIYIRIRGLGRLEKSAPDRAPPLLRDAALNQDDPRVRTEAVKALIRLKPSDLVTTLSLILLGDGTPALREEVAWSLARLGDASGRPALEKAAAADTNDRVRAAATSALRLLAR